ncbi:hypothetical protein [Tenacibaculum maritimum]|uniref:hypothetical protein n=1 Tax=Tenacibaculum maritimum TaxID=107401 RepID=UPI0012E6D59F|nr:hypothetical protein [Tenacibaculum maritimum]CAA0234592.1 Probable lipoprotein precursor [Tenacibaculum maritimum]
MKTLRKKLKSISMLMSFLILFASCNQYDDSITNDEQISKHSGEEIFNGLFFFQNDIASNIPKLKGISSELKDLKSNDEVVESLKEMSKISTDFINENYPNFFSDLKRTMYSGNLFEIKKSLNTSAKIIEQAALKSDKFSKAFVIGKQIENNEELKSEILKLDLNNPKDVAKFKNIATSNKSVEDVNFSPIWAVALAVYIVVGAVSFVVAAYSVVTKAAYWDPTSLEESLDEETIGREVVIAEIGDYFEKSK